MPRPHPRPHPQSLDHLSASCAQLYETLDHLVTALDFQHRMPPDCPPGLRRLYDPTWAIDGARRVLREDHPSRAAYQDYALHIELSTLAYDFALYLEELCAQHTVHPQHILEAMNEVVRLAHQSQSQSQSQKETP
jgi:hypothetical protein